MLGKYLEVCRCTDVGLGKYLEVKEVNFIPRVSAPSPEQLMMISDV